MNETMADIHWKDPRDFNLIPPAVLKHAERKRILLSLLITAAVILFMSMTVVTFFPSPRAGTSTPAQAVFPELTLTEAQLDLMKTRIHFSELLGKLGQAAQGKVWLSAFAYQGQSKMITVFGQGYSADHITQFVTEFQEIAGVKQGKIQSLSQDEDLIRVKWEGIFE